MACVDRTLNADKSISVAVGNALSKLFGQNMVPALNACCCVRSASRNFSCSLLDHFSGGVWIQEGRLARRVEQPDALRAVRHIRLAPIQHGVSNMEFLFNNFSCLNLVVSVR